MRFIQAGHWFLWMPLVLGSAGPGVAQYQVLETPASDAAAETEAFTWSAEVADGRITLSGNVPYASVDQLLLARAGEGADGTMTVLASGPSGFVRDALRAVGALTLFEAGRAEFSDGTWRISGVLRNGVTAETVQAQLGSPGIGEPWQLALEAADNGDAAGEPAAAVEPLPDVIAEVTAALQQKEPAELPGSSPAEAQEENDTSPAAFAESENIDASIATCRARTDAYMAERTILFASGSARLAPGAGEVLAGLADIFAVCPHAPVYVEGHTDADGGEEANLVLSLSRAEAVVEALVGLGVAPERLYAVGYGASLPVASNETAAGKALNRRIVFSFEDIAGEAGEAEQ